MPATRRNKSRPKPADTREAASLAAPPTLRPDPAPAQADTKPKLGAPTSGVDFKRTASTAGPRRPRHEPKPEPRPNEFTITLQGSKGGRAYRLTHRVTPGKAVGSVKGLVHDGRVCADADTMAALGAEDGDVFDVYLEPHAADYAALQTRLRHAYLFTPRGDGGARTITASGSTDASMSAYTSDTYADAGDTKPRVARADPGSRGVDFRRVPQAPGTPTTLVSAARPHNPAEFPINLQGSKDGRAYSIRYHTVPWARVEQVKRWMHYKFGYALDELRLIYDGRVCRDWDTMEQLGVEAGDWFDIFLEQTGG
ncbi:SUMO protein smt3 [Vanrija albida]|uniref:SUMO protein smt3 n=1 Tax=Vanrija albida TaxID=181172 RepID=A0ABR3Q3Z6_9TREE